MKLTETDIKSIVQSGEGYNPCGVVSAIKPNEFGTKSHSRNPLIFGLFNRMNMVEQVGSGIGRITKELEKSGLPKPVYKTDGLFTVIFKRTLNIKDKPEITDKVGSKVGSKVSSNQLKILLQMKKNPYITKEQLSKILKIRTTAIDNNIAKLKKAGKLKRVGPDKGGYWEVIDE